MVELGKQMPTAATTIRTMASQTASGVGYQLTLPFELATLTATRYMPTVISPTLSYESCATKRSQKPFAT